jgi:Fic family protein
MEDFVDQVNWRWANTDPVVLSSYVLWRMNHIHPFINGNGRTARAASYFVLCVRAGGWLAGDQILPELLRQNRDEYVEALKKADASVLVGEPDLSELHALIVKLLSVQFSGINGSAVNDPGNAATPDASPSH